MAGTEILIGFAISAAATAVSSALAPKQTLLPVDKGRFDDIRIQGSEYGAAIPIVYGRARVAGNIIYSDGVQPHVTTTPGRPGGKFGGGRPPEPPVNHYSYTTNIAIAICEGELKGGLKRVWENSKVTVGTDTNPLPDGTMIEAELSTNILTGDVQMVRDLAASNEYKAFLNGANSAIEIVSFTIPQTGNYNIKIVYMGLGTKTAEVFVGATSKGIQTFTSTGSDSIASVKTVVHNFTSTGTYNIKIKRDASNPAPYIDSVGVYGATATATANLTTGSVTSVTVTNGGGGYTAAPIVQFFGGGGSGATATANLTGGVVTSITVNTGGAGYTSPPTVDITPSVILFPSNVTGLVDPDIPFPTNSDYNYEYYNARLYPDVNGTASATQPYPNYIIDGYPTEADPTNPPIGGGGIGNTGFGNFTFYSGSETQIADPWLQTLEPNNVPAYRGTSYIVFKEYQIPEGQVPTFTFEIEEGTHDLAAILVHLWGRVGLDPSLLDVTALTGTFVEGLVINTRTPLSDILDTLTIAYAFDFVDLNGKVVAVKRGAGSVVGLLQDDLRAYEDGSEVPVAPLEISYVDVKELPKQIDVSFVDRAKSYFQNSVPAIRQIGFTEEPQTIVFPLVMSAAQAKEIGNRVLNTIYMQKALFSFTLPPKYSYLSPTDIVTLTVTGGSTGSETNEVNYASSATGTVVSSSSIATGYNVNSVVDGNKATPNWGTGSAVVSGNGWNSSGASFPQWVELNFGIARTITRIDVVTLQDGFSSSTPPTLSSTFTLYGLTAYQVQYWNGSIWVDIAAVTGNNLVWRQFTFPAVTTNKIRVLMTASPDNVSRLAELEAWGASEIGSSYKVTHTLRITQFQTGMPGLCKVQAVPDSASLYAGTFSTAVQEGTEIPPIPFPARSAYVLMDIPALLPEHTGYGFYGAACGAGFGQWTGAHIYKEEVLNTNLWERLGSFEIPCTVGVVGNSLSNSPSYTDIGGGNLIDTTSSITVNLYAGLLESFTNAQLFTNPNLNLCYIGGELVQFATASSMVIGTDPFVRQYTLTNFRRGLNGTAAKIGGHSSNEDFVLMDSAVQWLRLPAGQLFTNYRYKVASVGQPLTGASPITFNTGSGSAPPVASNLAYTLQEITAQDGTTQIIIRGTFKFGTYIGGQRAKIFIRRPLAAGGTEATYTNTGIVVVPDANNNGAFEIPAAVQGSYIIQVVTMSPFEQSQTTGHPTITIPVTADTTPPATPSAPVPVFDGQMVTWNWTQSTNPAHSYYQVYNGATDTVLSDGVRVDGNQYVEYPVSGTQRKIRSVNRSGTPSALSPAGTFTLTAPSAPTSYSVIFNGAELLHTWVLASATPQHTYDVADGTPTVLATVGTTAWTETSPPASRSFTRQVRSKLFGVNSTYTSTTVTIPTPNAPTSVSFDTATATPFDIVVLIVPNGAMNRRQIRRTTVEIRNSADSATLQTLVFDGIAESVTVSGRFLNAPNNVIKVRAFYSDFIGAGSTAITPDTYTFPAITGTDIGNSTITGTNINSNAINASHIQDGVITIAEFASTIRPVEIYTASTTSLPTLPNAAYPDGAILYWANASVVADRVNWQNRAGTWVKAAPVSFSDITGTITSAQIQDGTITDADINAAANFSRITSSGIQASITGGGIITWGVSATNRLTWDTRFISIPNGLSSSGYIDFGPTNGTAMGAGVNFVTLTDWQALFFRFPIGGAFGAANSGGNIAFNAAAAGWFVVDYTNYTSGFTVPNGYKDFMIGVHNGDNHNLYLWDGRVIQQGSQIDGGMAVSYNSITTPQILAGSITTAKLAASSITADKLAVGLQVGNLALNPSFEQQYTVVTGDFYQTAGVTAGTIVATAWKSTTNNVTAVTAASQSITPSDGNYVLKLVASSGNVLSKGMPVTAGVTYLIRCRAYGVGSTSGFTLGVIQGTALDANGFTTQTSTTTIESAVSVPASWSEYGTPRVSPFYYTVPAGITYISMYVANTSGTVYVDEVVVSKQFGTVYIQNGAITADLINANAVRAQHIQVGTFSEGLQLNPKFVDGLAGYYTSGGTQLGSPFVVTTDTTIPATWTGITTNIPVLQNSGSTQANAYGNWIPFDPEETYYFEVWLRSPSTQSRVYVGLHVDGAGAANSGEGRYFVNFVLVPNTWTKYTGVIGKNAQNTAGNLKWTDAFTFNDGSAGITNSSKFRLYIITNFGGTGAGLNVAQISIMRMVEGSLVVNGTITASNIATGTITATQIAAGTITATQIATDTITAGQIAAGAISASEIAAGAVRADKLAVGVIQDNLVANSSFESFEPTTYSAGTNKPVGWELAENTTGTPDWTIEQGSGLFSEGSSSLKFNGSGTWDVTHTMIPVVSGRKYIMRYKYRTAATAGSFGVHLNRLTTTPVAAGKRYIGASALTAEVQARDAFDITLTNLADSASLFQLPLASTGGNFIQKEIVWTCDAATKWICLIFRTTSANAPVYLDEVDIRQEITGVIIQDGTVSANKIVAGSITSTQIQAGSITVDSLQTRVLGDNLVLNEGFESFDSATSRPYNWKNVLGGAPTWSVSTAQSADGARSLSLLNSAGTASDIGSEAMPVSAGDKYYVSFKAKVPTATAGTFSVVLLEYNTTLATGKKYIGDDANGSDIVDYTSFTSFVDAATGATFDPATTSTYMNTTWKRFEMEYTVPVGVKYVTVLFRQLSGTNAIFWDSVVVRKYVAGVQIEDGTIKAPKIQAGAITADKIAVGSGLSANLIMNPSFETFNSSFVPDAWVFAQEGSATSIVSSTDFVADGAYSAKIAAGSSSYTSIAFPVVFGQNYTISFKLRSEASSGAYYVRVHEYNTTLPAGVRFIGGGTGGEVINSTTEIDLINTYNGALESLSAAAITTLSGSFKQKQANYTPTTSTVKYASLTFYNWGGNAALYVDDVVFTKKVSGVLIENGTITADKLVIGGTSDNLIANPSFESWDLVADRPVAWNRHATDVMARQTIGSSNSYAMKHTATGGGVTSRAIPVTPGTRIAIRFRAWGDSNGHALNVTPLFVTALIAGVEFIGGGVSEGPTHQPWESYSPLKRGDGTSFTEPLSVTTTPTLYEGYVDVPAGKYWMSFATFNTSGITYIDDIDCRKQMGQAFISDLRADQLVANTGQIGLVFADQIRQRNFIPYQTGSTYTAEFDFDYSLSTGAGYDVAYDTIYALTSTSWDNTNTIATGAYQKIKAGSNGYVEFTIEIVNANHAWMMGLSANWNPTAYASGSYYFALDYAWYFYGPGSGGSTLFVMEADNNAFAAGTVAVGDVLRVSIEEDYVRYRKNGVLIYTSAYRPSTGTIRNGTRNGVTLNTAGRDFRGAFLSGAAANPPQIIYFRSPKLVQEGIGKGWKLNPLSGSQLYADEPIWDSTYISGNISSNLQAGSSIQKHASLGADTWNTSAVTTQQINAGDGWFQMTINSATPGYSFFGLTSNTDWANPNYIPYATYVIHVFVAGPSAQVWENGVYTGISVGYALGNTFRVAIDGGSIKYLKDGVVFYEHPVATDSVATGVVNNGGSGYTSPPSVSITGGGGTGATAIANISGGAVVAIVITNGGSGYTSAPTLSMTGGGGTGASGSATLGTISYPLRGKVWLYSASAKLENLLFTASSSGLGEFNSGITVRGKRIEDVVKIATQSIRSDNRYRGNDSAVPSNLISTIKYDAYFVSWEDNMCFITITINFNDYKTNITKNMDSVKHVRARVYNKFGEILRQTETAYHGRGVAYSGYFPREAADGRQEAVYSFEFENIYGYSVPLWYSEASWLNKTTDTWAELTNPNLSSFAPLWLSRNDVAMNVTATTLTSSSVQITWTKAVNDSSWSYQVYYRKFKADGYASAETLGGWIVAGSATTSAFKTVTGLQADTRYEFMVESTSSTYSWSAFAQTRTYAVTVAASVYGAPTGLSGTVISSTQINLAWTKNDTANYVETEIWRTSAAAGSVPVTPDETATQVSSGLTGTTYSNTGLTANTVYSYRARNKYTGPIYSEWSNVATVQTPVTTPTNPPLISSVSSSGYYALNVRFTGNNGSGNYRIQASADPTFSTLDADDLFSNPDGGTYTRTIGGLVPGSDYAVRVSKNGTGVWSATAYGSTYPYSGGDDGDTCVLETEPITVIRFDGTVEEIAANAVKTTDKILGTVAGRREVTPAAVRATKIIEVDKLLHITMKNGASIKCSVSHRPITGFDDATGQRAETLKEGDVLLVLDKATNLPTLDIIDSIQYIEGRFNIVEISLYSEEHTYVGGGIFAHNRKIFTF